MSQTSIPRRVLIVRPSALGDVCRTVPVLASLRRAWPDATIDWVVRDTLAASVAAHPGLDEVIAFPRSRFGACWRHPGIARETMAWFSGLHRRKYDLVLDCQGLSRSGLITRATGAPRRVGYRSARELAVLAYTQRVVCDPAGHTVDAMLSLVSAVGVEPIIDMRLYVDEADHAWWTAQRPTPKPYAVLAATARWETKRWPGERWRAVAKHLLERGWSRLVLVGAPGEEGQVTDLTRDGDDARVADYVGRASIGRTMAIIAGAGLVVAHDSAPLHMAVGFDRPCVGLFGPTDPERVGPYRRPEAVVRAVSSPPAGSYRDRRLGDALMRRISVDDVIERIEAVTSGERAVDVAVADVQDSSAVAGGARP